MTWWIVLLSTFFIWEDFTIKELQINDEIKSKEVRLIGAGGEALGVLTFSEALLMAEEKNLDLVNVSPSQDPPVCKILDYGKYRFDTIKKEKEAKKNQKFAEMKEVWLSMTIEEHDLHVKAKQAEKFLKFGDKVKVSIRLRGRQMAHSQLGIGVMNDFAHILNEICSVEKRPSLDGRSIIMILAPNK